MGAAKLFGDKAALKALKEGEESGVKEYQELLQDPTTPNDVKTVLNNICSKEQTHIQQLDRLMQTA
jgi:rubrerythrin